MNETSQVAVSTCHLAPLAIVEHSNGDRTGHCPVCGKQCWVWLDGGTLDLGDE